MAVAPGRMHARQSVCSMQVPVVGCHIDSMFALRWVEALACIGPVNFCVT